MLTSVPELHLLLVLEPLAEVLKGWLRRHITLLEVARTESAMMDSGVRLSILHLSLYEVATCTTLLDGVNPRQVCPVLLVPFGLERGNQLPEATLIGDVLQAAAAITSYLLGQGYLLLRHVIC